MKKSLYKISITTALIVSSSLFGLLPKSAVIHSQTVRQLPTRIRVEDTPADITFTSGPSHIVGTGDFNGDGVDDFLVEYQKIIGEDSNTIVFIKFGMIFGKRNQTKPVTTNLSKDEPDLSLTIDLKGTLGNPSIAKLGDLNGDGADDLVLTQQLSGEDGKPGDRVFKIFFGSPGLQPGVIDLDGLQPDLRVIADRGVAATGIAGVADVNGDGVRDLLLMENAYYTNFALPILIGPFTAGQTIDLNSHQPDAIITANSILDRIDRVFLADINGDGITDMLIRKSRYYERFFGLTFTTLDVVFGSPNLTGGSVVSLSDGEADAILGGVDFSAVATGDVNGDGIDDILTGAPTYNGEPAPPSWFSGSVKIILGSRSMHGIVNRADVCVHGLPPPNPFHPIYQTTLGDRLGDSIVAGDIDGDGIPDILMGAPERTSDAKGRLEFLTRVHVVLGSAEINREACIETGLEEQDLTIGSGSKTRGVGLLIGSGDFNGDGFSDILVGSYSAVYVFFGGPLRAPEITKARYRSGSSELSIFGADFTGLARAEINGVVIDRKLTFEPDTNRLDLHAEKSELNLRDGKNWIVVIRKGARSNSIKLKIQ